MFHYCVISIPIYYINLDENVNRKYTLEKHLQEANLLSYSKRVQALTPETCNLILYESSCPHRHVSNTEIAILCSHINAIATAVTDDSDIAITSDYALILEDDIRFKFSINFTELIESAITSNGEFGILQLMMSLTDDIELHYHKWLYNSSNVWTARSIDSDAIMWSAQAYIINKSLVKPYIENVISKDRFGNVGYKLAAISNFKKAHDFTSKYKPLVVSRCMYADVFIYSIGNPVYILNIPIFNSALTGCNSSLHQHHVPFHIHGFHTIQTIQASMLDLLKRNSSQHHSSNLNSIVIIPKFIQPFNNLFSEIETNWTLAASINQRPYIPNKKSLPRKDAQ